MQRSHGSISAKILFAVAVGALGSSLVACQGQSIGMDQGDSGVANDATTNRGDATPTDANVPFDAPVDATLACTGNQMTCSGVCTDLTSDTNNCGVCGTVCPAGNVCSMGECALGCYGGTSVCGTSCVDLKDDPKNCGVCGTACSGGQVCSQGACALTCVGGTTDCNGSCVNLASDRTNCLACGTMCASGQVCTTGGCAASCLAPQVACTSGLMGAADSGTTTDAGASGVSDAGSTQTVCAALATDNQNCGSCGNACATGYACSNGTCQVSCGSGLATCGTDAGADGGAPYCANLSSDPNNCNACGNICPSGSVCNNGTCGLTCETGFTKCLENDAGSICSDITSDLANCGACGNRCALGFTCQNKVCTDTCQVGLTSCNNNDAGATCVNTVTDPNNCGACGNVCPSGFACTGSGVCTNNCQAGLTSCNNHDAGATCVNLITDRNNCGSCGNTCPSGFTCGVTGCSDVCQSGLTACNNNDAGNICADLTQDNLNCGSCGNACLAGFVCSNLKCTATCAAGYQTCGTILAPYCASTSNDVNNCGACGNVCALGQVCSNGACENPGYSNCADSGTPTATFSDPNNCGGCGVVCSGATPICSQSKCVATCPTNYTATADNRCQRTYAIPLSATYGFTSVGTCNMFPSQPIEDESESISATYSSTAGVQTSQITDNPFGFVVDDTAAADGFKAVTRVSLVFESGETYAEGTVRNNTTNQTTFPSVSFGPENITLNGAAFGSYSEASSAMCVAANGGEAAHSGVQSFSNVTGTPISQYNIGANNIFEITLTTPTCTPPANGYCQVYGYVGLADSDAFGPGDIGQLTVVY